MCVGIGVNFLRKVGGSYGKRGVGAYKGSLGEKLLAGFRGRLPGQRVYGSAWK